jgi:putative transposase
VVAVVFRGFGGLRLVVDGAAHRELYNAALQDWRDAWAHNKARIHYGDQSAQLTEIRAARPIQAVWSFSS